MGNPKKQKVAKDGFSFIALSLIDRSSFNPRKAFDENELAELAQSIKEKGVIQPILVRPLGERFEIVCGERRYRASLLAETETIPACIKELSDDDAEELAITENLQRKDVSPMEEAKAFVRLSEKGKYGIETLAAKFGKSQSFIRNRMKLVQLHPAFSNLLEEERINIGVASVLASFSSDIQEDVFLKHFEENCPPYCSWLNYRPARLLSEIENSYSTCLDKYSFDKEACMSCPFNTATFSLFDQNDKGKCTKRECLDAKNGDYLYDKAIGMQNANPELFFCKDRYSYSNENLIARLVENGYEVSVANIVDDYSVNEPIMPLRENFDSDAEFQDALVNYEDENEEYAANVQECQELISKGEIKACIAINRMDVVLSYVGVDKEDGEAHNGADITVPHNNNVVVSNPEITKMQQKVARNLELCSEKIAESQRGLVKAMELPDNELSELEWALLFKFLIRKLDAALLEKLGFGNQWYNIEYTDLLELTAEQKALLIRGFVAANLAECYLPSSRVMGDNPLRAFLVQHDGDKVNAIDKEWESTYKKRNDRLQERIEAIQISEVAAADEEEAPDGAA